ncbi:MAG: hypothetical protein JF597_50515 [Streptomyces sp.]|uniref:helical backbone metal receptor n=1 Tax=Streptomyces sp. TaxID=1931 RepID=UPI0025F00B27|nr:helical backbone metal receptor [Streptomyces sp.]MBW8801486.1 hypothetical protein [Streptomyces sp.]
MTVIETVPQALDAPERLFNEVLDSSVPDWLYVARDLWSGPLPDVAASVAVPIWRDPWMVVGSSTSTGDLLRRAGLGNAFADHPDRYPTLALDESAQRDVDMVLLPDEPYVFNEDDGPEAFPHTDPAGQRSADHLVRAVLGARSRHADRARR